MVTISMKRQGELIRIYRLLEFTLTFLPEINSLIFHVKDFGFVHRSNNWGQTVVESCNRLPKLMILWLFITPVFFKLIDNDTMVILLGFS